MKNLKVYILTSDKTCDKILEISLYSWKKYKKNIKTNKNIKNNKTE